MTRFLVEVYVPRLREDDAGPAGRARAAAKQLSRDGIRIRHIRTTLLPDDETCFHVFEAHSAETVGEVTRRAGADGARIVRAIE